MSPIERSGGGGGGTTSPLTTKGDVYTFSTVNARLPIGSDHQVLTAASAASTGNDWEYPPGFEIGYDQITSSVFVTSTTEATGTTLITCAAHTFDGGPVICTFSADRANLPQKDGAGNPNFLVVSLFEGATQITRLSFALIAQNITSGAGLFVTQQVPLVGAYRFTPTAGSHTYTITAHVSFNVGSPNVQAGAGGTATDAPCFVRFTKV